MPVRKCPKCGSIWYTELLKCAFCGVDGEEVKGPISPAKLNLGKGGVSAGPAPEPKETAAVAVAEATPPPQPAPVPRPAPAVEAEPVKIEAPPPPPMPEKPPVVAAPPPRPERVLQPRPEPAAAAPAPRIPSAIVPVVFAALGLVACAILPLMGALRHNRAAEILALLAFAVLSPFAPFAWFAGQRYADQCRALGFAPASAAHTGKGLGTLATFLLVLEISALAVFIVVQALSGKVVCPLWK